MNAAMAKLGHWFMPKGQPNRPLLGIIVCAMAILVLGYMAESTHSSYKDLNEPEGKANTFAGTSAGQPKQAQEPLPPGQPPLPTPIGTSSEPLWSEHNQRLLILESGIAAMKQEINQLKAQASQCQAQVDSLKQETNPKSEPAPPPVAAISGETTVEHASITPSRPTGKKTVKRGQIRKSHPKRPRRTKHRPSQQAAVRDGYTFNTPLVVEAVNSWGSQKRVVVREPKSRQLRHLKIGDDLGGWTIEGTQGKDVVLHNKQGRVLLKMQDEGGRQ